MKRKFIATCKTEPLFLYSPIKSETYSLKMQLDVEESTPASDMTVLFHSRIAIGNCQHANTSNVLLHYCELWAMCEPYPLTMHTFRDMNYYLVLNFGRVTRVTPDRQKAMHKSPP